MLKTEQWPIERLVPYARNPRKNDEQVERMVSAIREFGFRIPVVAKSDGTVVDGHLRLKAAKQMGMTEIPVALADELTDAQVKAFRILANRSANWAEWDNDLLKLEMEDLTLEGFNLELTGFEPVELEAFVPQDIEQRQEDVREAGAGSLADRFGVPPFSILNAREGWWQSRKRAWLSLGIQSELGRGGEMIINGQARLNEIQRKVCPGGSPRPACNYSKSKSRGNGAGRAIG